MITLLREIANESELICFEDNHDFNFQEVFTNIKIYPLHVKFVMAEYEGKTISLAAFACNQRYFIVKSLQDKEILEEKRWMITP